MRNVSMADKYNLKIICAKLNQIRTLLFCILLASLAFAEWKFIGIPIKGRPIVFDFNGNLSISFFDLVFALFAIVTLPAIWQAYKQKVLFNWHLFCWIFCFLLAVILFIQQKPILPYLTLSSANVIDFRSFIIHFAVAVCIAFAVIKIPLSRIMKGAYIFYGVAGLCSGVLCVVALSALPFFSLNYPFNTPCSISFPFPSQNMAAIFMSLCLVGSIGIATTRGFKNLILIVPPIFLLSASLTGSRSNILVCVVTIIFYLAIYISYYHYFSFVNMIHPAMILVTLFIGVSLILFFIDWQPIARSTSIFKEVWMKPFDIMMGGGKGSPRSELMSKALNSTEQKKFSGYDYSQLETRYSVGLTSVSEGCKSLSNSISDLKMGKPYYVRLILTPKRNNEYKAELDLFEVDHGKTLVNRVENSFYSSQHLSNIYYFTADTGTYYIHLDARLSGFVNGIGNSRDSDCLSSKSLFFTQEPYNGGAGPCISLSGNQIDIAADSKRLRGYISDTLNIDEKAPLILEYVVNVKSAMLSVYDPPVVFYVGLSDNKITDPKNSSSISIQNGLLIRHELYVNESLTSFFMYKLQLNKLNDWCILKGIEEASCREIESFNNEIRCGHDGQNMISHLWEPMLPDNTRLSKISLREPYIIKNHGDVKHLISVQADKNWSANQVLAGRGSTHNVYLDWYYYVGPYSFGLFICFVIFLLGAFAHFTWKVRSSKEFPFILSVFCQLLIITLLMYGHPYLFLKYIWFVFGLATAIIIHPDLKETTVGI